MAEITTSSASGVTISATLAILLAALLLPLSFTGGVVTTPAISQALHGGPLSLAWLTNGFMLTFGSGLLAAGVAADKLRYKRVFIAGLALFSLSSLLIALTESTFTLGIYRALQGIAAALTLAGGATALAHLYSGPARTRAFSLLGTLFGVGLAFGPLLMGVITDALSWRWVYALLSALAAIVGLVGQFSVVSAPAAHSPSADIRGTALFSLALLALTTTLILLPQYGVSSSAAIVGIVVTLLASWRFIRHTQRIAHPVFSLALLRQPHFAGVLLLPVATCYCYVVLLIVIPLYLMGARNLSEIQSAIILLSLTAPMLLFPGVAAGLTRWFDAGKISVAGLLLATLGLVGMAYAITLNELTLLAVSMAITGAGAALPWGLMDGLAVSAVSVDRAGMAAGLFNTVRVAGEGIALAIVMALLALLNRLGLQQRLPGLDDVTRDNAAVWLSGSHIHQAQELLPQISASLLRLNVQHAYQILLYGLAAITFGCAIVVGILLKQPVKQG